MGKLSMTTAALEALLTKLKGDALTDDQRALVNLMAEGAFATRVLGPYGSQRELALSTIEWLTAMAQNLKKVGEDNSVGIGIFAELGSYLREWSDNGTWPTVGDPLVLVPDYGEEPSVNWTELKRLKSVDAHFLIDRTPLTIDLTDAPAGPWAVEFQLSGTILCPLIVGAGVSLVLCMPGVAVDEGTTVFGGEIQKEFFLPDDFGTPTVRSMRVTLFKQNSTAKAVMLLTPC